MGGPQTAELDDARLIAWQLRWRAQAELNELLARHGINPAVVRRTDDNLALPRGSSRSALAMPVSPAPPPATPLRLALHGSSPGKIVRCQITLCYPREREISGALMAPIDAVHAQITN